MTISPNAKKLAKIVIGDIQGGKMATLSLSPKSEKLTCETLSFISDSVEGVKVHQRGNSIDIFPPKAKTDYINGVKPIGEFLDELCSAPLSDMTESKELSNTKITTKRLQDLITSEIMNFRSNRQISERVIDLEPPNPEQQDRDLSNLKHLNIEISPEFDYDEASMMWSCSIHILIDNTIIATAKGEDDHVSDAIYRALPKLFVKSAIDREARQKMHAAIMELVPEQIRDIPQEILHDEGP